MIISHILAATDLSQETLACIAPIANLARSLNARVTLLHVAQAMESIPHGAPLAPPLRHPQDHEALEAARAKLLERRSEYGPDVSVETQLVTGADVAKEITSYAEANGVDLIAVATHGRTGFRRLALGSVAEAVIRHSSVPVLVLPRPKE